MKNEQDMYCVGHTRFDQWSMGAVCVLVVPFFFLPLLTGWGPPAVMLLFYLGLCLIFSFTLRLFLETFNNLFLYQEGIEIHKPFKPVQFLFWDEIYLIRGSVWSSDLIISNRRRNVSCRVNSSYSNTSVLLQLLLYARSDLFAADCPLTFTISPIPVIILAVTLVLMVLVGMHGVFYSSVSTVSFILLAGCLVIFVGVLLLIPYSLSILGNQILFRYPFRKTHLSAPEVACINKITRFDFIYEWGEVTVHAQNGNVTLLMFYNLGVSLLYAFITSWRQAAIRPRLAAGSAMESTLRHGHRRLSADAPYLLPAKINKA